MLSIQELRNLSQEELVKELKKIETDLHSLRLKKDAGQAHHSADFKKMRTYVARIKTVISQISTLPTVA